MRVTIKDVTLWYFDQMRVIERELMMWKIEQLRRDNLESVMMQEYGWIKVIL